MKKVFAVIFIGFFTASCAAPIPVSIALWALDGASFMSTGKTMTDHVISTVFEKDCSLLRVVTDGELCSDAPYDGTQMADASPTWVDGSKRDDYALDARVIAQNKENKASQVAEVESPIVDIVWSAEARALAAPLPTELMDPGDVVIENAPASVATVVDIEWNTVPHAIMIDDTADTTPAYPSTKDDEIATAPDIEWLTQAPPPEKEEASVLRQPTSVSDPIQLASIDPTIGHEAPVHPSRIEQVKADSARVLKETRRSNDDDPGTVAASVEDEIVKEKPVSNNLYYVIGSFQRDDFAYRLADRHNRLGARVVTGTPYEKIVYRVVIGPFDVKAKKAFRRKIISAGIFDAWTVKIDPINWEFAARRRLTETASLPDIDTTMGLPY